MTRPKRAHSSKREKDIKVEVGKRLECDSSVCTSLLTHTCKDTHLGLVQMDVFFFLQKAVTKCGKRMLSEIAQTDNGVIGTS